jgi:hypothetical protein
MDWKKRFEEYLRIGEASVKFRKVDGTLRTMACTLIPILLPPLEERDGCSKCNPPKTPNPDVCVVWDAEKSAWRSFRWDSVVQVVMPYPDEGYVDTVDVYPTDYILHAF